MLSIKLEKIPAIRGLLKGFLANATTKEGRERFASDLRFINDFERNRPSTEQPKYKWRPVKEAVEEFYLERGRDHRSLSLTLIYAEVWAHILTDELLFSKLDEFETILTEQAIVEWGDDSTVCFDRAKKIVKINSYRRFLKETYPPAVNHD